MKILLLSIIACSALIYVANTHTDEPKPQAVTLPPVPPKDTVLAKAAKAIATIESHNNPKARRFEPRVFTRLTGLVALTFNEAKALNWRAAMLSTSCGKYQLLGTNYRKAGFDRIERMFHASEVEQDSAFMRFIRTQNIAHLLHARKWKQFARCYNGAGYRKNRYDVKLACLMEGA